MPIFIIKELAQQRYETCKACDKLTAIKTCSECGCFMPAKVKFAASTCPLNKWATGNNTTIDDYNVDE